jgi:hypothetical protein
MRRTLIALAFGALGTAHAATVAVFNNLAAWQAAVSGSVQTQDFSGDAVGTDLTGVAVLPGVTLTSNLGPVQVFGADHTAMAFGPRNLGNAYYEAQYALPFLATALDIVAFESIPGNGSTGVDQGVLSFMFSDGTSQGLAISGGDGSPIFIGVVSDTVITSLRWTEPHEASGGNEETSLDNLRVAMRAPGNELPLPGSLPLALLALLPLSFTRRRR